MSTNKHEEICKLFNKLETIDKTDLETYYEGRKATFADRKYRKVHTVMIVESQKKDGGYNYES